MTLNIGPHIVELRERVEDLEGQVAELRSLLALDEDVLALRRLGFTEAEARIVNLLLARDTVSKDQVVFVMHPNNTDRRYDIHPNGAAVHICRINAKLRPYGASVAAVWGFGWRMSQENRERLSSLLRGVTGHSSVSTPRAAE